LDVLKYGDLITLKNQLSMMTLGALINRTDISENLKKRTAQKGIFISNLPVSEPFLFDSPDFIKNQTRTIDLHMPVEPDEKIFIYLPDMLDSEQPVNGSDDEDSVSLVPVFNRHGVLFFNKPAGVSMNTIRPGDSEVQIRPFRFINRLDRDTTGLFGATMSGLIHSAVNPGEMKKTYLAIAGGKAQYKCGLIKCTIKKENISASPKRIVSDLFIENIQKGSDKAGQEKAEPVLPGQCLTEYRLVTSWTDEKTGLGLNLLEITLLTGRTHQIRASLQAAGMPVLGDPLYSGPKDFFTPGRSLIKRQALHSWKCTFKVPYAMGTKSICAPIPNDMLCLIPQNLQANLTRPQA
jgi:23S rRNA-/tRNA-specific pseudouridylate synthase